MFKSLHFAAMERKAHETLCLLHKSVFYSPSFSFCRENHPKVLERLGLLECIAADMQHTITWDFGGT